MMDTNTLDLETAPIHDINADGPCDGTRCGYCGVCDSRGKEIVRLRAELAEARRLDDDDDFEAVMRRAESLIKHANRLVSDEWGEDLAEVLTIGREAGATERGYVLEDLIEAAHHTSLARAIASRWADPEAKEVSERAGRRCKEFTQAVRDLIIFEHAQAS